MEIEQTDQIGRCGSFLVIIFLVINQLKMPPVRGRPKGAEKTVIGLPCKTAKKESRPMPFMKKFLDRER